MRRLLILAGCALLAVGAFSELAAQDVVKTLNKVHATVAPAQASSPAGAPKTPSEQGIADNYLLGGESLYRHMNDRDPFTPLVRGTGAQGSDVKVKPGQAGLARFTVEACNLEAIIKAPQGTVAWFQGPDGKPYKATVGEHFADGVVLDISYASGEITIQQELNDPTAIKPFRNLVLKIRSQEGEGQ